MDYTSLKIIDFGTSHRFQSEDEELEGVIGTMFYMAPEVFLGKYTNKCDIWSIGVILYILFYGDAPFGAQA